MNARLKNFWKQAVSDIFCRGMVLVLIITVWLGCYCTAVSAAEPNSLAGTPLYDVNEANSLTETQSCDVNEVNSLQAGSLGSELQKPVIDVCDSNGLLTESTGSGGGFVAFTLSTADANDVNNLTQGKSYSTIQAAINEANDFDVIEAACRVYKENIDFLGKSITVKSSDVNDWITVGSAVIAANDVNVSTVKFTSSEDADALLQGFTITAGAHGIECNGTSPRIFNCIIVLNGGDDVTGGGICDCNDASPLISNCFIVDNDANNGAGIYNDNSSPTIRNCVFSGNSAVSLGGAIYDVNSSAELVGCVFTENNALYGGGLCNQGGQSQPQVINGIFRDNSVDDSGDEIYNIDSAEPNFFYCDINNCKPGGVWDANLGSDRGGNIDSDPCFADNEPVFEFDEVLDSIVSWWRLDEGNGNTAYDSTGDNDGELLGDACYGSARLGEYSLALDGSGDCVCVADDDSLTPSTALTLAGWVYIDTVSWSDRTAIACKYYWLGDRGYTLEIGKNKNLDKTSLAVIISETMGSFNGKIVYGSKLEAERWYHVAFTFEPNHVVLYLDGLIDVNDTDSAIADSIPNNDEPLYIGYSKDENCYFDGKIDDVRIYDRTLLSQEIYNLYELGTAGAAAYWKLDDGSGSTAEDSAGEHDGTVTEAQWADGRVAGCLDFDGSGDYAQADSAGELKLGSSGSVSIWICPKDMYRHTIVEKRGGTAGGNRNENYWLTFGSSNQCVLIIGDGVNYISATIPQEYFVAENWCYVVGLWDSDSIRIYLNGQLIDSQTNTLSSVVSSDIYPVRTGYDSRAGWYYDGLLDQVRIYRRALSGDEIAALYEYGLARHYNYVLDMNSPCINAGDPNRSYNGQVDIDNALRVQRGVVDIGVDEVPGVYNVNRDEYYQTIQAGLDDANDGDTVLVYQGRYYEQIDFNGVACTLTGSDANDTNAVAATIIDGDDTSYGINVVTFDNSEDANSILRGFTITGGWRGVYCGWQRPPSPTIERCDISDNEYFGLWCGTESPTVERCRITHNGYGGVHCTGPVTLRNCVIASNEGKAIQINAPLEPKIINCTIVNNDGPGVNEDCNELTNCIFWANSPDLYRSTASYSCIEDAEPGYYNFGVEPLFVDANNGDYHLQIRSWCIDAGDPCSDYSNEPNGGGGRINIGAYGNTEEATVRIDIDDDNLPDQWELSYWPDDEPNQHDPEDDPDADGFTNWIEYLFGYDPNQTTNASMEVFCPMNFKQIDPTKSQLFNFNYWLNMDANVVISFIETDSDSATRQFSRSVSAGTADSVFWDGRNSDGQYAPRYFYDIVIDANDGNGHSVNWQSPTGSAKYMTGGIIDIDSSGFDPYKNIPIGFDCQFYDWGKGGVRIVKHNEHAVTIYDRDHDKFIAPGAGNYYWYGRWWDDVNDPNYRNICQDKFDVRFFSAGSVLGGAALVYYNDLLSNLRTHPYRIVPTYEQVTTITYNLSAAAKVTIDITDPDGNYLLTLLDDAVQSAGSHEVIWYGGDGTPEDPNTGLAVAEGVYLIEVYIKDSDEKLDGSITVYK